MMRDIALTLDGKPLNYVSISPLFYDGHGHPHLTVQAKHGPNNDKFALLLRLDPGDVWVEVARDEAIWGAPALVQRPDGTAYLSGQRRDMRLHIGADIPDWTGR